MQEDVTDPTPTTAPGKRASSQGNLRDFPAVDEFPFEDTGQFSTNLYSRLEATGPDEGGIKPEDFIDFLASKIASHGGSGGGDGGDGKAHVKQIKRHNYLAVIMAALLGPGGAIAVIYATSDRAKANSAQVEHLNEATKAMEPRMEKTEESVRLIQVNVGKMKTSVDAVQIQQTDIAAGIESLKQENVNRLQRELDTANRELRRRSRNED